MHSIWFYLGWAVLAAFAYAVLASYLLLKRIVPKGFTLRQFAKKSAESGYLPPPPNAAAVKLTNRASRLMAAIVPGPVTVIGAENLNPPGPCIIAPNHGSAMDPRMFPLVMRGEPLRFMAARGVFQALWGLGGLIVGSCGGFAADLNPGQGGGARLRAVDVLVSGQKLVMFPEGWAWLNGEVHEFKKGAVRIVKAAAAELGKPTYLVPVYIRYGRYPGDWILKLPPSIQYYLILRFWYRFRKGAIIVVGKPIRHDELPADDGDATEFLRQKVLALDPKPELQRKTP